MSLLDLKTNLTSLKFGRDRLNGGDSGQPYIKTPIIGDRYATQNPPKTLVELAAMNKTSLDYPIRGGALNYEIGGQTLTLSSKVDRERIKKFLEDSPRGLAFINKQVGLQLTNPKTETGTTLSAPFSGISALPGILENTRVYNNGKNTLAQVAVSGTGYHLPRAGLFPFDVTARYYAKTVGAQLNMSNDEVQLENRLLILQQLKLRSANQIVDRSTVLGAINKINQLGISLNRQIIQNYLGGPGSSYGIGSTVIRRFDDTTTAVRKAKSGNIKSYDQIMNQTINQNKNRTVLDIQDFKTGQKFASGSREVIYRMSMSGSRDEMYASSNLIYQENAWQGELVTPDMIKFGFECVNNDVPSEGLFLQFRAYLTSGITDGHQAGFNSFKYLGRGDDFHVYQGFSRTIGFSFRVAVEHSEDIRNVYNRINALASQVYPDYSQNGVMRTSVTRVTVGDYLYRVPGFIESVSITVNQDSSWEISEGLQLPHYLDVTISFKPIHEFLPERVTNKNYGNVNRLIYNVKNSEDLEAINIRNTSIKPTTGAQVRGLQPPTMG